MGQTSRTPSSYQGFKTTAEDAGEEGLEDYSIYIFNLRFKN